ncbi:MAG: L,D-transpeptidase family protein [Sulfuricurvum sp.]|uniref:L,D-transpeptidase family protein n=1 Tax=Sulfuricurvum sp. TaxID=2025608 RepID=UPI00261E05FB|nr:L,D-transpeptidase family protein [Sulfuricurvum sp.]MDD2369931.1 L,D-transpeptidase family protein [Sulfuricurvum sp.]MDD5118932.1 L,D-transpeptidase family protein [Sulfuricurvum sp.]
MTKKIAIILLSVSLLTYFSFLFFVTTDEQKTLIPKNSIDSLVVYKSKHRLLAYSGTKLMKTYPISIGKNSIGHKEFEGDKKTPEGNYTINTKNPNSGWHKNLGISYPNTEDIKHAKSLGKPPGGNIKIHALRNGFGFIGKLHRSFDWTNGCIAVTDEEIDELYDAVNLGASIEIRP